MKNSVYPIAPGDSDSAAQRPRRMSLLRAVRPGMRDGFKFQLEPGHDSSRREDWPLYHDHWTPWRAELVGRQMAKLRRYRISTRIDEKKARIHARRLVRGGQCLRIARGFC